jgi:hypothetical protein
MKLLPDWLWIKEHREVAMFIGAGAVALIAGVWAVFVYFDSHHSPDVASRIYRVCKSDNKNKCMPQSYTIGCTDLDDWAETQCSHYEIIPIPVN